jgi:hypothetical protein
MRRIAIACGGLLLAAVVASGVRPGPASARLAEPRATWEYKVLTTSAIEKRGGANRDAFAAGLDSLGGEGWELAAIEPGHVPAPVRLPRYVFKRAK